MLDNIMDSVAEEVIENALVEALVEGPNEAPIEEPAVEEPVASEEPSEAVQEEPEMVPEEPAVEEPAVPDFGAMLMPLLERLDALENQLAGLPSMMVASGGVVQENGPADYVSEPVIDEGELDDSSELILSPVEDWDLSI